MHYKPPMKDDKIQWVPIVVKNKDWLIGYINGIQLVNSLIMKSLKNNGIDINLKNLKGLDLCIDSSRFNDVLQNGKRESDCTLEEMRKYYTDLFQQKMDLLKNDHPDNFDVFDDCFLEVECGVCGLGVYSFKEASEIPNERFHCQICGNVVIDYTGVDDDEIEFDGELVSRFDDLFDEIKKQYERKLKEENDENDD